MRDAILVLAFVAACSHPPDAPRPIVYDKEACAHCHMLIGDPKFAAQLVTDGGDVLDFDDPGCAMAYLAAEHPKVRHLWFRDSKGDRWLDADRARFVVVTASPMGWDLAAVDGATPGALTLADAEARVAAQGEAR